MNLRPTRTSFYFLCFFGISLLLILSCSKDFDTLRDAVLNEEVILINEEEDSTTTGQPENEAEDEREEFESRTTIFFPVHDAYLQNGKGYNQEIIRLQENQQTSYLMFDLSQIDAIGGTISAASIEFVINQDDGTGKIQVFKGSSSQWTEDNLTENSAPEIDVLLGKIEQDYKINTKVSIDLKATELLPEFFTLILNHKDGDDLAFASKESETERGPKLMVTYDAPISAEAIVIVDNQSIEEVEEENTEEEEEETTAEEESTEEEDEETTEEETTEEEETTAEEESTEEEDEETTEEETAEEETTEEEDEETTQEDEEETSEEEETTAQEEPNRAPVAVTEAVPSSGLAPLDVNFTGNKSSDDKAVTSYIWNFKDGSSSSNASPSHTFNTPGTYTVELTVQDENGLTNTDAITITVRAPENEAPIAVASVNLLTGDAPLELMFTGIDSSDDKGIVNYNWNFPNTSSTASNTSYTFDTPGVYDIMLTVTDAEGLQDTETLTITVTKASVGNLPCGAGGGKADETGSKIWCWDTINLPNFSDRTGVDFSNKELHIDSECYEKQVTRVGNKLKFRINPTTPNVESWCSRDFNMRAEIRTAPWNVRHAQGTEEWFGWSYEFGGDYVIDQNNEWLFFQVHPGITGVSPHTELFINKKGQYSNEAGQIFVINNANGQDRHPTGITPKAGDKLNIVVHAIWGNAATGKLEVWINGAKVYDKQVATIYAQYPWGGNAKWGIYKWPWAEANGVQQSQQQGLTHIETYMGTLRMITRRPGDADYGKNSYAIVAPD